MRILANLNVAGTLDIDTVANAGVDTDRFLVQDSNGFIKYRTGAELASDIGAAIDDSVVHLAGTETITGTKTFTAATTTFAKVVANSPTGGATGEGLVVGSSFKVDASGEGQSAKIYVVTKDLNDTYGSGLQIQFANIEDNKGFGFNLNTAGGYELYTKDAGAAWIKAMTVSNTQLATFHGNVRLANYTTNGFVKTSSSNGTITIDPAAFTLTTTGASGPATYNSGTGILNIPEYLGASGIRIVYNFTATAGQTTFTVTSYTPGVIDVFYNGSRLNEDEYTATNGTTIVLDTACSVGDLVDIIVYQGNINGFSGVGGSGTINQLTYWTGANTIGALSTTTYPSLTEISYVKGVTSAIQTQLDAKVPTSRTLTINGTSYDLSANRSWTITAGITGSGTANQIAYWDGSSSVAGSTFLTQNLTADYGYLILTGGATYKNADIWLNRYSDDWENAIRFQTNGTTDWYLGSSATGSNNNLEFFSYGTSSAALTLLRASANANFGASVGIGSTTLTGYSLRVSRTMVGDTASGITSFGVVSDGTVQAAVTSGAFGFNSALSTAAAAFTLDSLIHFRATQGTIGSTSAVTNQYGFAALGTMTGATNNYGFFGSLDSATGRWNLYMIGTARNYLAGDTSIGTTTGGYKLNVSGTANISGVLTGTTGTFSSTLTGTGLRSFAVNTGQTPNNNAGWYTLARFNTYPPFLNTNGNSGIITLDFYGGGLYTPSRFRIFYFKDDANIATLKLEKYGAVDYIQEVRIRYRTGDTRYYIEIYCDSHASGLTFDIHHDRLLGYGEQLEIFGGVLDAASGTGTILSNLSFVDHGTTVSNLRVETASSFTSSVTASSFVKSGGLTTQFLKADGTVDSSTYLTTSSVSSTYVPYSGATQAVNLGAYDLTVNGLTIGRGVGSQSSNTAIGNSALSSTAGVSNTAVGTNALNNSTSYNTAVGHNALLNKFFGHSNVAIGYRAGFKDQSGIGNIFIGAEADVADNNVYSNSIAIGNNAVITQTNSTVIGNSSTVLSTIYGALKQTSVTSAMLKADAAGKLIAAVAGTDYVIPSGSILGSSASAPILTASGSLTTQYGNGTIGYSAALINPQTGLFAAVDNSNAIITINRHPDNYYSQLGFSSNGNLYYRSFSAAAINTSQGWQTIWTSNSLTNLNQLTNGPGYITSSATISGASAALSARDNRTISPSEDNAAQLKFGFTAWNNNDAPGWADYLHLRSYSDNSGGGDNLIMFYKNGFGMRQWQQTFGSATAYSSYVDYLHSSNYSSYALPLTGGIMTGDIQMGNNQNRIIKFRTATAWDYSLKGINDDFFITDNPGLNFLACYYNGGANNRYLSLVGGFNVFPSGKMSFTSSNYMTGSPTHGFRFNSANDAFNNVIMRDNGNVEVRGSLIAGSVGSAPQATIQAVGGLRWSTGGNSYFTYSDMDGGGLYIETVDNNTGRAKMRFQVRVNNSGSYTAYHIDANNSQHFWNIQDATRMSLNNSGTLTVSGDVIAYGSPSDATLKTIKSKVNNAIDKVSKLNGYYFDWNNIDSLTNIKEDIGVIAQEVQQVFPELARTNENGKMSVRYQGLTAVLIEAIKELADENKQIKEELNKLKN